MLGEDKSQGWRIWPIWALQWDGGVLAPLGPLCLWLSLNPRPTVLPAGRWEWPGGKRNGRCWQEERLQPTGEGL